MKSYLKRTWAVVDLDKLEENLTALRTITDESKTKIACVVKANAYGHDDKNIAPFLESLGINFFAVSNIREAANLRKCGVKGEILILGHTPPEYAPELAEYDIIQTAVSDEYARTLSREAEKAEAKIKIHMAVDTGMGRIGLRASDEISCLETAEKIKAAAALDGIILDGLFTHYAAADSESDSDVCYTKEQTENFFKVCTALANMGMTLRHTHCLNSAGGALRPDSRSTLVRYGIMLYGLKPDINLSLPVQISPVMELKAAVSYVKPLPAGSFVSYGRRYRADREIICATVPIGYADGYPRSLSGKAYLLINGRRAPVIGRICMDQLMADVTDIPGVREGTEVTLIGRDGEECITADELGAMCGTIGYEIVCGISKRVPRVITRGGRITDVVEYY